jgi:hypothetical protein
MFNFLIGTTDPRYGDENQTAARSIKLLLLTGARRNEITPAKW